MRVFYSATKSANSLNVICVASVIFAIVLQEGQRGVPSGAKCLLLLNVVASNPLSFANPEQLKPFFFASISIACQSVLCVK